MTGNAIKGSDAFGGCVWNANGCETTWKPEITLISEEPTAAPAGADMLAIRCVGLSTQTRFTITSPVPNPTVTCPLTKFVFTPVISTIAETPAGSDEGVTLI